ncbi:MAG: NADP-dependent malic enzyme [Nisaea sp.]|nr:NADP-dependent malic enzyme [Nisaea sp.]OUY00335.1 MAG: NADP-dependent malic enzyme [Candidatus Endolissoclinum sp. TMED26]
MADELKQAALNYHRLPRPGKLAIEATKPMTTQRDLALAYSPGVAAACAEIVADPDTAADYTSRANMVGVVTNGTAVLGLGDIGPLASKPVMEGKAVLFKKFADIDVFDLELDERDPDRFIQAVAAMEPTFGGINLEDIKAPDCFYIERALRERMRIPVFHDDQHGTAIIVAAAILNGLRVVGKTLSEVRLVTSGAGAAALACVNLLVNMGLRKENLVLTDIAGVVYRGRREEMDDFKIEFAVDTAARTLGDVIADADVFLGLSAPAVLKPEMVAKMADKPLIMALANPVPEIMPDEIKAVRDDAVIATGRTDYPNQVNNVIVFPFIFRGALDVGATAINEEMKIAAVRAIADLAMQESSEIVAKAYGGDEIAFGPDYIIPKPFDPRLIIEIAPAVAEAAMASGVARRKIADLAAYRADLEAFVFRSGQIMRPVFQRAKQQPKRLVYAEGEDERVLRAAQTVIDEGLAWPILIGRPEVITNRIQKLGLRLRIGENCELTNPLLDDRYVQYWQRYHELMERRGVTPSRAREIVRTRTSTIAALMVELGQADAGICGTVGRYLDHFNEVRDVIGLAEGVHDLSAVTLLIMQGGAFFLADTHVTMDPDADDLVEMTMLAAEEVRRFGIEPKVAFLSHSNFGSTDHPNAVKMRTAVANLRQRAPDLEVEGEMHGDFAVDVQSRAAIFPNSQLKGTANLLIMPNLDSANIAFNLLKSTGNGLPVGPMLVGSAKPVHVLNQSVTVRGILNMSAVAVVDAQDVARGRRLA